MPDTNPPKHAGKVAIIAVGVVIAVIVMIFVGLNLSHYRSAQSERNGQLPPDTNRTDAKPQGPHDLGAEPSSHR